jgi:quinol monooxygenase YgiN
MLGVVATIKIKEGKGAEFEKVATALVNKVNENEKELPAVSALGEAPNTYVFMERYADQAAVEAHRRTEYSKTLGRTMAEYMDGKPIMQRFKQVGRKMNCAAVRCQSDRLNSTARVTFASRCSRRPAISSCRFRIGGA